MIVGTCTSYCATCFWIGRGRNLIAVEAEIGHIACGPYDSETVCCAGGNHLAVHCPISESVALIGCGCQRTSLEVVIGTCASYGTTSSWISRSYNFVAVQLEVGNEAGCLSDGETISCLGADHFAVSRPINEGVTFVGRGGQGASLEMVVSTCASYGTTRSRIGRGRDLIAVQLEVGHIVAASCHGETIIGTC